MKRLLSVLLVAAASLLLPGHALAVGQCGLPSRTPLWIDFGAPDLLPIFGRSGVIVTSSSGDFPAKVKATGAQTLYWDMHLNKRVGTPTAPANPATIEEKANRLFDYAATQTACEKPLIALNELFGASLETPWSDTNAQYRANVLTFMRTLAARGARPFLLISSVPYAGSDEAADWWREAASYGDLVPEVYFPAPQVMKLGPIVGPRRLRVGMRNAVTRFTRIGIPVSKLGVVAGFQTGRGSGGREGLARTPWLEYVKWNALAAREIARETKIATVWSWGWGAWGTAAADPDRGAAACVWLWTRSPTLCNAPKLAGPTFDTSLTEGQLRVPAGRQCTLGRSRSISSGALAALQAVTGDREVAFTALLARVSETPYAKVKTQRVLAAERAVIALRFGGSRGAYVAALSRARATVAVARAILADELRRQELQTRLPGRRAASREVTAFYESYRDLEVRRVRAKPAPWWLGAKTEGLALSAIAPEQLFRGGLPVGKKVQVRALDGTYTVTPLGDVETLGEVPLERARPAIAAALRAFSRRATFEGWTVDRQAHFLNSAICRRDDLPQPGAVRLSAYLPFLALS